jgi:hypothetical protein
MARYQKLDNVSIASSDDALLDDNNDRIPLLPANDRVNQNYQINQNSNRLQFLDEANVSNVHNVPSAPNANNNMYMKILIRNHICSNIVSIFGLSLIIFTIIDTNNSYATNNNSNKIFNANINYVYYYAWWIMSYYIFFNGTAILSGLVMIFCNYNDNTIIRLIDFYRMMFISGFLPRSILAFFLLSTIIGDQPMLKINSTEIQHEIINGYLEVYMPNYLQFIFLEWLIFSIICFLI